MSFTEPGLYEIPELEYHADPVMAGSFSSTMAKQILKSPAHLQCYLDEPRVEKAAYDFGHVVHAGVLGVGLEVEVLDFPDWRTKASKEAAALSRLEGRVPMLERDYAPARAAIEAIKAHPIAGPLFAGDGAPEQSAFGIDPDTGLWLRGRFDWTTPNGILVDLKTTQDGSPHKFKRAITDFGYDTQDAFYRHVYHLATGTEPRGFIFVTVETKAPHLVDVHELDPEWQAIGKQRARLAIDRYERALATGEWPGRAPVINSLSAPIWYLNENEEMEES